MKKTIHHQFFFPHPPEIVWQYLTDPELLELWLMKNTFQPVLGTEFQFQTRPIASLDFDGIMHCKLLTLVPPHSLAYTWNCGPGDGKITLESVVTWTLIPTAEGTEVNLEHTGFDKDENLNFFNGLNKGWVEKLNNIDKLLKEKIHGHTTS